MALNELSKINYTISAPRGCNFDVTVRLRFIGEFGEITAVEREVVDMEHPTLDSEVTVGELSEGLYRLYFKISCQ